MISFILSPCASLNTGAGTQEATGPGRRGPSPAAKADSNVRSQPLLCLPATAQWEFPGSTDTQQGSSAQGYLPTARGRSHGTKGKIRSKQQQKRKHEMRSSRDERDDRYRRRRENPNRLLVSAEVEHMENEKNLLLPQPECLHNCHFQFYIIPFSAHLFHV